MADRTLTINHADGGSETYTLKTEDVLGVRNMSVDGETVTIDRTAPDLVRTIIADGQTITIDTTREGVRTLTVDGTEITIDRSEEANLESFLQEFTGASAAYSLRDLAGSGNTTVVRVRRASDNSEKDFSASEVSSGTLTNWVGAGNDGFVETWYDQSGNGNDGVQQVSGSQPKIVDAGVLVSGGIEFDGVDDRLFGSHLLNTDDVLYAAVVAKNKDLTARGLYVSDVFYNTFTDNGGFAIEANTFGRTGNIAGWLDDRGVNDAVQDGLSSLTQNQVHLLSFDLSNGSSKFHLDGSLVNTFSTSMNSEDGGGILNIGNNASGIAGLEGSIKEIIIYNSDQSANREAIENNINNQYDIY